MGMFADNPLDRKLAADNYYQELLAECLNAETDYLRVVDTLPEKERQIIERYLTACEELDHRKLSLASEA